jgi:hypothetical protein
MALDRRMLKGEVDQIIWEWREQIAPSREHIRACQDRVLLRVGQEWMMYAVTAMSAMLGKEGLIQMNTTNTTIGTAGVAITGGTVSGPVQGNVQQNIATDARSALEHLSQLKKAFDASSELDPAKKEDAQAAIQDLEIEIQKPGIQQSRGRIRNAFSVVTTAVSLVNGAHQIFQLVAPYIEALMHAAK